MASILVRSSRPSLLFTKALRPSTFSTITGPPLKVGTEIPINTIKAEEHPKILAKEEYPEWLWTLTKMWSLPELVKIGYEGMTMEQKRRYVQLLSTKQIKQGNFEKVK